MKSDVVLQLNGILTVIAAELSYLNMNIPFSNWAFAVSKDTCLNVCMQNIETFCSYIQIPEGLTVALAPTTTHAHCNI